MCEIKVIKMETTERKTNWNERERVKKEMRPNTHRKYIEQEEEKRRKSRNKQRKNEPSIHTLV